MSPRDHLEPVAAAIRQEGGTAESVTCDVRDADQVEATVEPAFAAFGRLDVLINNHGASFFRAATRDPEGGGKGENLQATQLHRAFVCRASSRLPSQPWSTGVTRHGVPL
jgi:NAD(P)-dependent dehydrogenase (short-subunit alcohol dehydrogenase family)